MSCLSCAQGFHFECAIESIDDDVSPVPFDAAICCCNGSLDPLSFLGTDSGTGGHSGHVHPTDSTRRIGRPKLDDADVKDPRSTMRKRARAALKEAGRLHQNMKCEWRGLANLGLEKHPVVGCRDGMAKQVHHINKNIFDNELDNLVHICHRCHHKTHDNINPCTPRDNKNARKDYPLAQPRKATEEELALWNDQGESYPKATHEDCPLTGDEEND